MLDSEEQVQQRLPIRLPKAKLGSPGYSEEEADDDSATVLIGSEYVHKLITQLPKDYYLITGNCTIKLVDHIHEWIWIKTPIQIYDSLPKDYCLIPSNETIKLECGFP